MKYEDLLILQEQLRVEATRIRKELDLDTVQFVVTLELEGGRTTMCNGGAGNFYARKESCRAFVLRDDAEEYFGPIVKALEGGG